MSLFTIFLADAVPFYLFFCCRNCLWQKTAANWNDIHSTLILPFSLELHLFRLLLPLNTDPWWMPPVLWKLPAGCRAGRRKRRRRSCEPVWRSCWLVWSSSPRSSWCGHGGLAGSVGGETWWAPVGSVDLPQHWAPQIRSIIWHFLTLTARCSSETQSGSYMITSTLPSSFYQCCCVSIPGRKPH